jgi:ribonuclease HII
MMIASELLRLEKMSQYEKVLHKEGFQYIAGIDEAGRGPLAGPVVAACCILPRDFHLSYLNDSKQLTADERELLFKKITTHPEVQYGVSVIDVETIDEINILRASLLGMQKAVEMLQTAPDYLLVDGNKLPLFSAPAKAIVSGDALSISIAAASIIAKVVRDRIMEHIDRQYPQYGFKKHKGYATQAHIDAIYAHGPTAIHRKSFEPIKSILQPRLEQKTLF